MLYVTFIFLKMLKTKETVFIHQENKTKENRIYSPKKIKQRNTVYIHQQNKPKKYRIYLPTK